MIRPSICDFFIASSIKVWNRIRFVRSRNNRISGTTITENLLFDFWHAAETDRLRVKLYEAKKEYLNGNDFELFIETSKGFVIGPNLKQEWCGSFIISDI